ncbi:MAG TPA: DNA ligase [Verrucomicrobia bacterium]|nr:DNA ligase [Verrucomicrobiota bacterium]
MKPLLFIWTIILCQSISGAEAAPKLLLAKTWSETIDPTGWWISEKYDGMRGFWDGKALWTRGGKPIHAPEYFLAELPEGIALDGELWLRRGKFEDTMSIVRRQTPDTRWRQIKFMVFDAPKAKGTFEKRMAFLKTQLPATAKHVRPVPQWRCKGKAHLISERDRIVKAGAEGLMIREPESVYEGKRSGTLLKVKTHDDAEATVIGHKPGKGKFEGMLGSLRVRTKDGREFSVGTGLTNAERKNPPPIGAVVTYRYRGLTKNGLPRFPSFWRIRKDR